MTASELGRRVGAGLSTLAALAALAWHGGAWASGDDRSLEALLNTPISAAAKYEQTTREAPASVTVITSADIERYGWRTIDEALQTVRGMYVSNDRNYVHLGARGFGRPTDYNNRVLLLINGHTNNDNFYNSAALGPTLGVPLDAIERIEVVRGPGAALYGTGAVFAVIDVITKDASDVDGLRVSAEGGSFGRKGLSGVYGQELGQGASLTVSGRWSDVAGQDLYYPEYDDAETNGGVAEGLDWDRSGGAYGSLRIGDFRAQGMFSSRKTGIPTGAFEIAFNDPDTSTLDEEGFLELRYATEPSAKTGVVARGYLDYYHYVGVYPIEEEPHYMEANTSKWGGAELQLRWDPREYARHVIGVEAQRHFTVDYHIWQGDAQYLDRDFPFTLLSVYTHNTYQPLDELSLTLGVRTDMYSQGSDRASPRAAVVYTPSASSAIKLLYGEAFRVPSRFELFYEDAEAFKPNPLLKPESIRTAEAVLEQRIGPDLLGVVSVYRYEMIDLIDETVDPNDELSVYDNVSEVDAGGVEAELRAQIGARGRGYVSYAYQRAEDADSRQRITNSPAHLARAGAAVPVLPKVFVAAELIVESGRLTVQDTETDPLALLNLNLSTTDLFGGARAALLVRNVLDEAYAYPGGLEHLQAAILQNGREVAVTIEHRF
ncbi:TonB-dependent receptor [Candidatus Poribacteria bacterium]|jgi:outer membrane receptor for ferrienterochelin and colicins|nr:TonB-dependent receptor [Candidatus Poribacteria bacterium]MBT5536753.1 TonB-dependent receptor [Candidatus Poribacteria bacterium]MBT5710445.1 TonB-dependent receptor [Candidatus Poribacteria bacterium]MBT7097359.1 TonB-dependent receptor [Candidatus Poribacteria bacterium]MBT7807426.1 TonB-dependent receptor [Candidatus Poribacteria bacterium]